MVRSTLTNVIERHEDYTDKYFLRAKKVLQESKINPLVRYQIFARKDIEKIEGIDEVINFIQETAGNKVRIYALKEGQKYRANEPIMKLEGKVQDLIDLETVYLEILSGNLTGRIDMKDVRKNARAIVKAAEGKPIIYFGARHFHYFLDREIAKICKEEGFVGTSTDVGARAWNDKGKGTIPHALILSYAAYMHENGIKGNPTVEAAKGFDKYINKAVPRINLIDTSNREIDDSIETAKAVQDLVGVRIDTCGENYAQDSRKIILPDLDVPEKYLKGNGVKIAPVWALRQALDKSGFERLEVVVSSGFNAEKTTAFVKADKAYKELYGKPLFNSIGTGSIAKPIMTTSDIVAYFNEKSRLWIQLSKVGRCEKETSRLKEVV